MNKLLRLNKLVIPVVFSLFVFSSCNEKRDARSNESSYNGRIVVPEQTVYFLDTDRNKISSVEVQISDDVMERSQGLMDVRKLPENHGMLFKFDTEEPQVFGWQIPLCHWISCM